MNYQWDGLCTYPVTEEAKETELNTIENMLHNNQYNVNQIKNTQSHKNKRYILIHITM
jgi:hypothetical protein